MNDKISVEKVIVGHLSKFDNNEVTKKEKNTTEEFMDEHFMAISKRRWFVDIYETTKNVSEEYTWKENKPF